MWTCVDRSARSTRDYVGWRDRLSQPSMASMVSRCQLNAKRKVKILVFSFSLPYYQYFSIMDSRRLFQCQLIVQLIEIYCVYLSIRDRIDTLLLSSDGVIVASSAGSSTLAPLPLPPTAVAEGSICMRSKIRQKILRETLSITIIIEGGIRTCIPIKLFSFFRLQMIPREGFKSELIIYYIFRFVLHIFRLRLLYSLVAAQSKSSLRQQSAP